MLVFVLEGPKNLLTPPNILRPGIFLTFALELFSACRQDPRESLSYQNEEWYICLVDESLQNGHRETLPGNYPQEAVLKKAQWQIKHQLI